MEAILILLAQVRALSASLVESEGILPTSVRKTGNRLLADVQRACRKAGFEDMTLATLHTYVSNVNSLVPGGVHAHPREVQAVVGWLDTALEVVYAAVPGTMPADHWSLPNLPQATIAPEPEKPARGRPASHRHPETGLWMTREEMQALGTFGCPVCDDPILHDHDGNYSGLNLLAEALA